jgi:hypothetical protein
MAFPSLSLGKSISSAPLSKLAALVWLAVLAATSFGPIHLRPVG